MNRDEIILYVLGAVATTVWGWIRRKSGKARALEEQVTKGKKLLETAFAVVEAMDRAGTWSTVTDPIMRGKHKWTRAWAEILRGWRLDPTLPGDSPPAWLKELAEHGAEALAWIQKGAWHRNASPPAVVK